MGPGCGGCWCPSRFAGCVGPGVAGTGGTPLDACWLCAGRGSSPPREGVAADALSVRERAVWRWLAAAEQDEGVVRAPGERSAYPGRFTVTVEVRALLGLWKGKIAAVHRELTAHAARVVRPRRSRRCAARCGGAPGAVPAPGRPARKGAHGLGQGLPTEDGDRRVQRSRRHRRGPAPVHAAPERHGGGAEPGGGVDVPCRAARLCTPAPVGPAPGAAADEVLLDDFEDFTTRLSDWWPGGTPPTTLGPCRAGPRFSFVRWPLDAPSSPRPGHVGKTTDAAAATTVRAASTTIAVLAAITGRPRPDERSAHTAPSPVRANVSLPLPTLVPARPLPPVAHHAHVSCSKVADRELGSGFA